MYLRVGITNVIYWFSALREKKKKKLKIKESIPNYRDGIEHTSQYYSS